MFFVVPQHSPTKETQTAAARYANLKKIDIKERVFLVFISIDISVPLKWDEFKY